MAKFTFYQEYIPSVIRRDKYEITAESYEEAVRMIEENGGLFDIDCAERISSELVDIDPEGRNWNSPVSVLNEDEEEIL
jgi:hypothetical protein